MLHMDIVTTRYHRLHREVSEGSGPIVRIRRNSRRSISGIGYLGKLPTFPASFRIRRRSNLLCIVGITKMNCVLQNNI